MKYLEYISAAKAFNKAKHAMQSARTHEPEDCYAVTFSFNIFNWDQAVASTAADYDAMSKPCMEKLHTKTIQRAKKYCAIYLEQSGEDIIQERLDTLDAILEHILDQQ